MRSFALFAAIALSTITVEASSLWKRQDDGPGSCTTNQRKAWQKLTVEEKLAYIQAELCLMRSPSRLFDWAQNRWDELAYGHIVQFNIIHNVGAFLPWHRLYIRAHEQLLQTECNYTGAQPYWEEAFDTDNLPAAGVFDPNTGFGGNSDGECVTDGPFTDIELHVSQFSNDANYCLRRNFDSESFQWGTAEIIAQCFALTTFEAASDCYERMPHVAGHSGVGGTMGDVVTSPNEPLFFLHHANLDRLWWEWQLADLDTRLTDIGGRNTPSAEYLGFNNFTSPTSAWLDYDGDDGNVTTLTHTLWMVGLIPNATVGDVMDLRGGLICADYVPSSNR